MQSNRRKKNVILQQLIRLQLHVYYIEIPFVLTMIKQSVVGINTLQTVKELQLINKNTIFMSLRRLNGIRR